MERKSLTERISEVRKEIGPSWTDILADQSAALNKWGVSFHKVEFFARLINRIPLVFYRADTGVPETLGIEGFLRGEEIENYIGRVINKYRITNNMSEADLARIMRATPDMIWGYESGKINPRTKTLERISGVLGLIPAYFVEKEGVDYTNQIYGGTTNLHRKIKVRGRNSYLPSKHAITPQPHEPFYQALPNPTTLDVRANLEDMPTVPTSGTYEDIVIGSLRYSIWYLNGFSHKPPQSAREINQTIFLTDVSVAAYESAIPKITDKSAQQQAISLLKEFEALNERLKEKYSYPKTSRVSFVLPEQRVL